MCLPPLLRLRTTEKQPPPLPPEVLIDVLGRATISTDPASWKSLAALCVAEKSAAEECTAELFHYALQKFDLTPGVSPDADWEVKMEALAPFWVDETRHPGKDKQVVSSALLLCLQAIDEPSMLIEPIYQRRGLHTHDSETFRRTFYKPITEAQAEYLKSCLPVVKAALQMEGRCLLHLEGRCLLMLGRQHTTPTCVRVDDSEDLVLLAVKQHHGAIKWASTRLKQDANFMLRAVKTNGVVYRSLRWGMQQDDLFKLACAYGLHYQDVAQDGNLTLDEMLKLGRALNPSTIVLSTEGVKRDAINFVAKLWHVFYTNWSNLIHFHTYTEGFNAHWLSHCRPLVVHYSETTRFTKELHTEHPEFAQDVDIAIAQISHPNNGNSLEIFKGSFSDNKRFMARAMFLNGSAFQYASERLRGDIHLAKDAVRKNGLLLEHASANLQNHRDLVLEAAANNVNALEYASINLRSDGEFMTDMVKLYGVNALEYASTDLTSDGKFMTDMVKLYGVIALEQVRIGLNRNIPHAS